MPSVQALYNEEVLEGHREALAALRELLKQEKDPLERRKLANAILRARPVKDPEAEQPKAPPAPRQRAKVKAADDLDLEDEDFDDIDQDANEIARHVMTSPEPQVALRAFQTLLTSSMAPLTPCSGVTESS